VKLQGSGYAALAFAGDHQKLNIGLLSVR